MAFATGRLDESREHLSAALEMRRAAAACSDAAAPEHLAVAASGGALGLVLDKLGEFTVSRAFHAEAAELKLRHAGPSASTASSLSAAACATLALKEAGEALVLYDEALRMRLSVLGDHMDTCESLEDLAECCQRTGDAERAEELRRRAFAMRGRLR